MGVSRSASTVIAYAMKEYGWDLERAFDHVKERRTVTKPNPSFMKQLEEYQGILLARYRPNIESRGLWNCLFIPHTKSSWIKSRRIALPTHIGLRVIPVLLKKGQQRLWLEFPLCKCFWISIQWHCVASLLWSDACYVRLAVSPHSFCCAAFNVILCFHDCILVHTPQALCAFEER